MNKGQIIKITAGIVVIAGASFWMLYSSGKNFTTNTSNSNMGETQTSQVRAAIADFKEKYQATDNWQHNDWTIKKQIALLKESTLIVYQADVEDVFTNDKDIIVRTHIAPGAVSFFSEDANSNSYLFDLKCNDEDIVNKVIVHRPGYDDYLVVAKLTELQRPMLAYDAKSDGGDLSIYIDTNSSRTYIGKGECIDFAHIETTIR